MKKLIVSIKSSSETLVDFKRALKQARKGRLANDHFELSFDNKKDFEKFARNLGVLSAILTYKPKSVYELAKIIGQDTSNVTKLISFFEKVGAITVKQSRVSGRKVRTPIVDYDAIEFDLRAA